MKIQAKMNLCLNCQYCERHNSVIHHRAEELWCGIPEELCTKIGEKKYNGEEFPEDGFNVPMECPYILEHTLL